jgi:hypothetical protein
VTALLVQEFLGGTISRLIFPDGMRIYHNRTKFGVIDLTFEQHSPQKQAYYLDTLPDIEERTREQLLANTDTNYRYLVLRARVLKELGAL